MCNILQPPCSHETDVVIINEGDSDLDDFDLPPVNVTNRDTTDSTEISV